MTALCPWERPAAGPTAALAARIAALVPVIETERLTLRAPQIADFPIYARFMTDGPDTGEAAWLDFCQLVASWPLRGFGPWTMDLKASGESVGAIVLNHEFGDDEVEIGWTVTRAAEGRGYATEGARAAREYILGQMGVPTLVSYIDPDNPRSIAIALRLGTARDAKAEARLGNGCHVYRHPGVV
jgi:RimJ/RimL family protein N-acetyltransferase